MSRPVCQAAGCARDAWVTVPAYVLGVGPVSVRVCSACANGFLEVAERSSLDTRLAIARKRT